MEILTPEDMQRLAEDYARIRFPDRFPRFDFRALSPEGKSRSGWPDAYVALSDDRIEGVEATIDKNKSKIRDHLKKDLSNACKRVPKLTGFVFVSGQPMIQLNTDELNMWRQLFSDKAGIELKHIDLVFGGRLVQELALPEFARTRVEVLGVTELPAWFELVRPNIPPNNPQAKFIPTSDDYEKGRVHRPQVADQVLSHLEERGSALVRGVGACGKTVLAWLIALENVQKGWPTYYLDLARIDERVGDVSNVLENDLVRFGHPHVLFILDNIHLHEYMAKRLASAWEKLDHSQRPRLLLLGRELHTGRGSPIDGLNIPTLTLRALQSEVRGVYRRLVWRMTGIEAIPEPPPEVLNSWVMTFGGNPASPDTTTDLIAFSAAVLKRLPDIISQKWSLTVEDAVDEVREAYLKKLDDGEIRNLMRLAVLAECEMFLTEKALADPRKGFDVAGWKMGLVFRGQAGAKGQYVQYRLAHTALGPLLLAAAFNTVDIAKEQLAIALADPYSGFNLAHLLTVTGQPTRAKPILSKLMEDPRRLFELPHLTIFLNVLRLVQQHKAGPLNIVDRVLSEPVNRDRLVEIALLTLLGGLKAFLSYAGKTKELKTVFKTLTTELGNDQNRGRLVEIALLTPLGGLQSFLAYAGKTKGLKTVFETLITELGNDQNRRRLVERFTTTPLDQIVKILSVDTDHDIWSAVLVDVDEEEWELNRLRENEPKLDAFVRFQKLVTVKGRPELATASALSLIRKPDPEQWHQNSIGLHHLSHCLRCATKATQKEIRHFLDRIATGDWINYQMMEGAYVGGLAGNLLSLSTTLPPDLRNCFLCPSLRERVFKELTTNSLRGVGAWAEVLSLLGAAAALGLRLDTAETHWPSEEDLAAVLDLRAIDPQFAKLGPIQIQLWLGLREMARLREDTVSVPAKRGNEILNLWRMTHDEIGQSLPLYVNEVNAGMIAWLERCRTNGWCMIKDDG